MAKKNTIEAFDLLLKDVKNFEKFFGGKVIIFYSDFYQTLLVIPNDLRDQHIEGSFVNSVV